MNARPKFLSRAASAQAGWSLLEVSLAMALAAIVSIGYLYNQAKDSQFNGAKTQAGYFLAVNDGVGRYMQRYYDELKLMPVACSTVRLSAGQTPAPMAPGTVCTLASVTANGGTSPVNAMQPTVAELRSLGLIDAGFQDGFLWRTGTSVNAAYDPNCTSNCSTSARAAPARFASRIERWCDGNLITDDSTTCTSPVQLKSLVFNSQPFDTQSSGGLFALTRFEQMSTAIQAIGSDGLMSLDTPIDSEQQGKLYSVGNKNSLQNPIVYVDPNNTALHNKGLPGILAVQNSAEIRCSPQ